MFCTNCGAPNEEGAKFCVSCGKPLSATLPAAPASLQAGKAVSDKEKLGYYAICGFSGLMILAVFLPFIVLNFFGKYSMNYLGGGSLARELGGSKGGDGIILLIMSLILLVLVALHLFKTRMAGPCLVMAVLTGLLGVVLPLVSYGKMKSAMKGYNYKELMSFGVGFWFVLIAAIGILISAVLVIRSIFKKPLA